MILTLFVTVIVESAIVIAYSNWQHKPLQPLLYTSLLGNVLTQSLLWLVLWFSFRSYLAALFVAETFVWGIETLLLCGIPANKLNLQEAAILSLTMNMASLAFGWFLPV